MIEIIKRNIKSFGWIWVANIIIRNVYVCSWMYEYMWHYMVEQAWAKNSPNNA